MKLKEFYIKDKNSTTCILPPITSTEVVFKTYDIAISGSTQDEALVNELMELEVQAIIPTYKIDNNRIVPYVLVYLSKSSKKIDGNYIKWGGNQNG